MEVLIPIALILVGLVLVAAEVYLVPGLNVIGAAGVLSMAGGVVYAFSTSGAAGGLAALVGAILSGGMLFLFLWRSGAWDRFILADTLARDGDLDLLEQEARLQHIGRSGVALSPLRPTGVAEISGERLEVQTEGAYIAAGSRVKVVAMDRRRFFVRLEEEDRLEEENA